MNEKPFHRFAELVALSQQGLEYPLTVDACEKLRADCAHLETLIRACSRVAPRGESIVACTSPATRAAAPDLQALAEFGDTLKELALWLSPQPVWECDGKDYRQFFIGREPPPEPLTGPQYANQYFIPRPNPSQ